MDSDAEFPRDTPSITRWIVKVRDHDASECQDHIAVEEPLEIRLAGMNLSITMRTPGQDEDMTLVGFVRPGGLNVYAGGHRLTAKVGEFA